MKSSLTVIKYHNGWLDELVHEVLKLISIESRLELIFSIHVKSGDGKPEHPMPIAVVLNKVDLRETNPAMVQIERDEIMQTLKLHSSQVSFDTL